MNIELIKKIPIDSNESKKILVIGVMHGDEPQGEYFINSYLCKKSVSMKNILYYIPRLNSEDTRKNKNGVDLNRNFPTKNWVKSENNNYYGGENPNSEEETKYLTELINREKFDSIVTIHSPYKVINYDGPAEILANKIKSFLDYPVTSDIGYPTPGSFGTYCGVERNTPTITIEIDEEESIEKLKMKFCKLFDF